jgi:hypothetical protein
MPSSSDNSKAVKHWQSTGFQTNPKYTISEMPDQPSTNQSEINVNYRFSRHDFVISLAWHRDGWENMKSMDHQITNWGDEDVTSVWQPQHREQLREPHVSPRRDELKTKNSFSETDESNHESSALCEQPTPVSFRKARQQTTWTNQLYLPSTNTMPRCSFLITSPCSTRISHIPSNRPIKICHGSYYVISR